MGGKLIKQYGFESKRLNKSDYLELVNQIKNVFDNKFSNIKHCEVPYVRSKETFGDVDYMVEAMPIDYTKFINDNFKTSFVHKNGMVYSFEIECFQVDLILINSECFDFAKTYYSFNDIIGNLVGRFAHKFGCSLGHAGLFYTLREDLFTGDYNHQGNQLEQVLLTRDPRTAWEFLGTNYDKVLEGFNTIEEAFQFVLDGEFFDPDIFSYENLNHINRTRNKKRENYQKFVDLLESDKEKYRKFTFSKIKMDYFSYITANFPNLINDIEVIKIDYFKKKENSKKFNGKLVQEWTGLEAGQELGKVIMAFKKSFSDFNEAVDINDSATIKKLFLKFYIDFL